MPRLSILFVTLINAAVLGFGALQVMAGHMTAGGLLAFLILTGLFLRPAPRLADLADDIQALEVDFLRLEDILRAEHDRIGSGAQADVLATLNGRWHLTGRVELRGITFGYKWGQKPLLEDFSLDIRPGQRVALVGPSGSGKSTLAYLVCGLYRPWSGEILFDGQPIDAIPSAVLQRSLSMVDQNTVLFNATFRENITLWSPAVSDSDLSAAARDAAIHDEIVRRPLGYEGLVKEDGRNLSGGQRQRLEIARALVGNPSILVLDEASSALDATTEERIDSALRARGCTCLIIAHRLSTIRDCDEIIVLDRGRIIQRGVHEELMLDREGLYRRLVHAEG